MNAYSAPGGGAWVIAANQDNIRQLKKEFVDLVKWCRELESRCAKLETQVELLVGLCGGRCRGEGK